MIKKSDKLKSLLLNFKSEATNKKVKSKVKKLIVWTFVLGSFIALFILGIFFYFYINWQSDRNLILKQAEIYYNQILKETDFITHYKSIGSSEYQLKNVEEPIKVYDYRGELLGEFSNERRSFVDMQHIAPTFFYALFATEDVEFYNHTGVNFKAILRAMIKNILAVRLVEGGSTITQQLSKLLFTDRGRNLKRKIYEFFCARELETIYTKEDILMMYSNLIFLGHGAYGVENASQLYFKKPAKDMDIGESSFLVAMISNPSRYSPFSHRKNALAKHKAVLNRMKELGYITAESAEKIYKDFWSSKKFVAAELSKGQSMIRGNEAPWVMEEVRRFLVKEYGDSFFLKYRGAQVYTTIDKRLQIYASEVLQKNLKYLRTIISYKASRSKDKVQGAIIFTTPEKGEIRVLVGGEKFVTENQFNRVFQAKRQVGSTLKPFLYLAGLEKKVITPYDIFEDKPITIEIEGAPEDQKYWEVNNYNKDYKGYLTVTEALYRSANVVMAQVGYKIGMEVLQDLLTETLGLSRKEGEARFPSYQYSLALGATEMTPYEVNRLFCMLANKGQTREPFLITKIIDNKSRIKFEAEQLSPRKIVSLEANFLLINMMRRVFGRGGTAGSIRRMFNLEMDLAGKTGTTQDHRDTWFNGFNPSLAGTVWIGHDANESLGSNFTGGAASAPIWGAIMKKASEYYPMGSFNLDPSLRIIRQPVCLLSGKVPVEGKCKHVETEAYFIEGTEPGEYCPLSEQEEERRLRVRAGINDDTDPEAAKPEEKAETDASE